MIWHVCTVGKVLVSWSAGNRCTYGPSYLCMYEQANAQLRINTTSTKRGRGRISATLSTNHAPAPPELQPDALRYAGPPDSLALASGSLDSSHRRRDGLGKSRDDVTVGPTPELTEPSRRSGESGRSWPWRHPGVSCKQGPPTAWDVRVMLVVSIDLLPSMMERTLVGRSQTWGTSAS